ncbi:transketolase [Ferrimicrobium sp.]|uniref:transketolase n=1 Tax=Ferrimicrobium sp. TaxID=2926050 RepID=UPI0026247E66|nr:transketolase [Ferrimicrobium sp.]
MAPNFGYEDLTNLIRLMTGDEKHEASAHSTLDVVWVLYDSVLRVNAASLEDPMRDRLVISKGHGPMALYAVLAAKGMIPIDELVAYGRYDSALGWHPDRLRIGAIEVSSGSLGHGLAIAVGIAYGLRLCRLLTPRVFCLLGDGELDEGSVHETIALAGRLHLDNLTAVVIDNESATYGWPGGIARRFEVEGWRGVTVDGHDHQQLAKALDRDESLRGGSPRVVVCELARADLRPNSINKVWES